MGRNAKQPVDDENWRPARLIPTTGLRSETEKEGRATSVLLAVMYAVPEFGASLLSYGRAPAGRMQTFVEVPFMDTSTNEEARPDGAIVVRRGKTQWCCLVEVKTGHSPLEHSQIEQYVRIATQNGFDAVLTISNEIASSAGECPIQLERRLVHNVRLFHLSWFRILTEAVLAHEHRGVSDPDQAWILSELIAYLRHPKSGTGDFEDMGRHWTQVRDGARHRTLQASDRAVQDVSENWEEFVQYLCLQLCQHLGRDVAPLYPRKMDRTARLEAIAASLADGGRMLATIRVPDAVGPISIEADLQSRLVTLSVDIQAPNDGRPKTRVNWLLRQLRDAPDDLRVEVAFARTKQSTARLLGEVRNDPDRLLLPSDPKREPRGFSLALAARMGTKRSKGPKSFVGEAEKQLFDFYGRIVQDLQSWTPRAPKLPEEPGPPSPREIPADSESRSKDTAPEIAEESLPQTTVKEVHPPESVDEA